MKWVALLCFLPFSTAALALDDCNAKFPSTGQLEDRLKCLQANNNSLQSQLDVLKAGSGGEHAIARPEAEPLVAKPVAKPGTKPVAKPEVIAPQPLSKEDCKKAGMQWNNNANVCGSTQLIPKPVARSNEPHVTTRQLLTRAKCKKAGLPWNSNSNVCALSATPGSRQERGRPRVQT
jgi:hypothetical protein